MWPHSRHKQDRVWNSWQGKRNPLRRTTPGMDRLLAWVAVRRMLGFGIARERAKGGDRERWGRRVRKAWRGNKRPAMIAGKGGRERERDRARGDETLTPTTKIEFFLFFIFLYVELGRKERISWFGWLEFDWVQFGVLETGPALCCLLEKCSKFINWCLYGMDHNYIFCIISCHAYIY